MFVHDTLETGLLRHRPEPVLDLGRQTGKAGAVLFLRDPVSPPKPPQCPARREVSKGAIAPVTGELGVLLAVQQALAAASTNNAA